MPNGATYEFPEATAPVEDAAKCEALVVPARATGIVVRDQAGLDAANAFLTEIKTRQSYFSELYDPQIAKAHALHKGLVADKKKFTDPLDRAASIIKPKIADYLYEEDQKRLAAARARQLAEEQAKREAEKAADKAHELIQKGQEAKVEAVVEKAAAKIEAIQAAAPAMPEKPQADVSLRTTWDFEVVDASLVPRKYLIVDMVTIGKIVRAVKDQTDIPGIRVFPNRSVASKASRY